MHSLYFREWTLLLPVARHVKSNTGGMHIYVVNLNKYFMKLLAFATVIHEMINNTDGSFNVSLIFNVYHYFPFWSDEILFRNAASANADLMAVIFLGKYVHVLVKRRHLYYICWSFISTFSVELKTSLLITAKVRTDFDKPFS